MLDEATIRKIEDRYVTQHLIARQAGLHACRAGAAIPYMSVNLARLTSDVVV